MNVSAIGSLLVLLLSSCTVLVSLQCQYVPAGSTVSMPDTGTIGYSTDAGISSFQSWQVI